MIVALAVPITETSVAVIAVSITTVAAALITSWGKWQAARTKAESDRRLAELQIAAQERAALLHECEERVSRCAESNRQLQAKLLDAEIRAARGTEPTAAPK